MFIGSYAPQFSSYFYCLVSASSSKVLADLLGNGKRPDQPIPYQLWLTAQQEPTAETDKTGINWLSL